MPCRIEQQATKVGFTIFFLRTLTGPNDAKTRAFRIFMWSHVTKSRLLLPTFGSRLFALATLVCNCNTQMNTASLYRPATVDPLWHTLGCSGNLFLAGTPQPGSDSGSGCRESCVNERRACVRRALLCLLLGRSGSLGAI